MSKTKVTVASNRTIYPVKVIGDSSFCLQGLEKEKREGKQQWQIEEEKVQAEAAVKDHTSL